MATNDAQEVLDAVQAPDTSDSNSDDMFADFNFATVEPSMEAMLKAGVHFGHKKARRHPRMCPYIYTTRKDVNIIDLQKSLVKLEDAMEFLRKIKSEGRQVLFVGTKKQYKDLVTSIAKRVGMPFVVDRWLGGTFTNFKAIRVRANYLKKSEEMLEKGEFKKYTKFEQSKKMEEIDKLDRRMGGIKEMNSLPAAMFVASIKEDILAIKEAMHVGIPIVALADTNTDPTNIDYPIPANDDAVSSLQLMFSYIGKALDEQTPAEAKETK